MKKINIIAAVASAALTLGAVSCTSADFSKILSGATSSVAKPTMSFKDISINGLDKEGITFNCKYDVSNPYNVAVSLAKVAADITCDGKAFTSLNANEGISLAAKSTKTNNFNFKVPYDSLLNFAKSYKNGSSSLPFNIAGSVGLDLSKVTSLTNKTLSLPFNKSFNAPIIKPSLSLSSPKLVWPSLNDIKNAALKNLSVTDAAKFIKGLTVDKKIDTELLQKLDLNLKLNFDLGVKNEGNSAWSYLLKSCAINTNNSGNSLINLGNVGASEITGSSGTVPLTATLNTVTAASFIASIFNKTGTNPKFSFNSGVKFPGLFNTEVPLNYEKEIPLSSISSSFGN